MNLRTRHGDGYICAEISGDIDHHTAAEIRTELDGEISRTLPSMLIMDFSRVEFMDSSGVGLILGRQRLMESLGGAVAVKNPSSQVSRILALAGLGSLIITAAGINDKERSGNNAKAI